MKANRGSLKKSQGKKACDPRSLDIVPLRIKRRLTKRFEAMVREIDAAMESAMNRVEGHPAGLKVHSPERDYSGDYEFFVSPNWTHMMVDGPNMEV